MQGASKQHFHEKYNHFDGWWWRTPEGQAAAQRKGYPGKGFGGSSGSAPGKGDKSAAGRGGASDSGGNGGKGGGKSAGGGGGRDRR